MPSLREFLFNKDVGVEISGNLLHIGDSFLEHVTMAAEIFPEVLAAVEIEAVGGLAAGVAGPVLGMAGVFMALGSGYAEAREEIQNKAVQRGFAQGFVAGLLNMSPQTVLDLFGLKPGSVRNAWDPDAAVLEIKANNRGVVAGYALANTATPNEKKAYIFEIREFTGHVNSEPWNSDRVKKDYVLEYAAKLLQNFLQ